MSNTTFLCQKCFSLRRRELRATRPDSPPGRDFPNCCGQSMHVLGNRIKAEAASRLSRDERRRWIVAGMHVVRKPGNRWTAALTPRQIAASREQLEAQAKRLEQFNGPQAAVWDPARGEYVQKRQRGR